MSILRADSIRDRAGTGAPDFPNGLTGTLTGNVTGTATTATTATSATVATNAQGLTGTPSITVTNVTGNNGTFSGDVSGVNATFSGNLTVQGTTTTIDTAITSVDSLAVDGDISAGTKVLVGLTTTTLNHSIQAVASPQAEAIAIIGRASDDIGELTFFENDKTTRLGELQYRHDHVNFRCRVGELRFATGGTSDRLIINSTGTAIFKAGLAEKYRQGTTLAAASNDVALSSGNVHRFTTNESGAQTVNFTGVHSTLANGESVSFTVILTPNNSGYINAATVDGVAPFAGLKWSGGSAPTAGGASGRDVYTFTIFKDGTATNSYEIFGAVQNYA